MSQLLLLEDDPVLSREICDFLRGKGHECDPVFDGELFFRQYRTKKYEAFLLDVNVPRLNGMEVCRKVRENDSAIPVLMLTAFGEIEDKADAFRAGADDYLVKPFHLEELNMRIEALCRRAENPQSPAAALITVGTLELDLYQKTVSRAGQPLSLTPKEFGLLVLLAEARGRVLSKQQIAAALWDNQVEPSSNTIEVYINFLRNKIDKPFGSKLLHTKVGFGYSLREG